MRRLRRTARLNTLIVNTTKRTLITNRNTRHNTIMNLRRLPRVIDRINMELSRRITNRRLLLRRRVRVSSIDLRHPLQKKLLPLLLVNIMVRTLVTRRPHRLRSPHLIMIHRRVTRQGVNLGPTRFAPLRRASNNVLRLSMRQLRHSMRAIPNALTINRATVFHRRLTSRRRHPRIVILTINQNAKAGPTINLLITRSHLGVTVNTHRPLFITRRVRRQSGTIRPMKRALPTLTITTGPNTIPRIQPRHVRITQ